MNYSETIEYLFSAMPSFQNVGGDAYKPGLERMEAFCEALDNPQRQYRVVHLAGTNGKGSTSHMMAAVLQSAGYRVGLFTSPHLRDFRERVRVDGEVISECDVVEFVERNREAMERLQLSFFEMTAAMAFDHFARSEVDIAVVETGLGGRLDATNIVESQLSVVTNIAIDHVQYLGDTREKIAAEKAGIIKPNSVVVVGERGERGEGEACSHIFEARAEALSSRLVFAEESYSFVESVPEATHQKIALRRASDGAVVRYDLDLMGEYQYHNLITLLTAVEQLDITISEESLRRALRGVIPTTGLLGRWQRLCDAPLTICDTGHNLHGLSEVTRQIAHQSYQKLYCVLGFARDKELLKILPLFPRDAHFIFTQPAIERAFEAEHLAEVARSMGLRCEVVRGVMEAVRRAQSLATEEDMIFIGGSTFVVAEVDYSNDCISTNLL